MLTPEQMEMLLEAGKDHYCARKCDDPSATAHALGSEAMDIAASLVDADDLSCAADLVFEGMLEAERTACEFQRIAERKRD